MPIVPKLAAIKNAIAFLFRRPTQLVTMAIKIRPIKLIVAKFHQKKRLPLRHLKLM